MIPTDAGTTTNPPVNKIFKRSWPFPDSFEFSIWKIDFVVLFSYVLRDRVLASYKTESYYKIELDKIFQRERNEILPV